MRPGGPWQRHRRCLSQARDRALFSTGIPISYPRASLRSHSGSVPKISFSPKPPESTKQKKKKKRKTLTQPNQTVRAPRPPPRLTQTPPCPPPRPHPPPGRSGTRPGSLGAPSAVGTAILHRPAPVLPIRIGPLVLACWSTRGAWVWWAVVGRM